MTNILRGCLRRRRRKRGKKVRKRFNLSDNWIQLNLLDYNAGCLFRLIIEYFFPPLTYIQQENCMKRGRGNVSAPVHSTNLKSRKDDSILGEKGWLIPKPWKGDFWITPKGFIDRHSHIRHPHIFCHPFRVFIPWIIFLLEYCHPFGILESDLWFLSSDHCSLIGWLFCKG